MWKKMNKSSCIFTKAFCFLEKYFSIAPTYKPSLNRIKKYLKNLLDGKSQNLFQLNRWCGAGAPIHLNNFFIKYKIRIRVLAPYWKEALNHLIFQQFDGNKSSNWPLNSLQCKISSNLGIRFLGNLNWARRSTEHKFTKKLFNQLTFSRGRLSKILHFLELRSSGIQNSKWIFFLYRICLFRNIYSTLPSYFLANLFLFSFRDHP